MEICACPFLSDGKLTVVTCRELCVAVFLWNAMMFQRRPSQLWFVTFTTCQLMSKWSVRADIGSWCWSHSQSCPSHFAGSLLLEFRQEDAGTWALLRRSELGNLIIMYYPAVWFVLVCCFLSLVGLVLLCFCFVLFVLPSCCKMMYIQSFGGFCKADNDWCWGTF